MYTTHKKLGIFDFQVKFQNAPKMHHNFTGELNLTFSKLLNVHVQLLNVSVLIA